MTAPIIALEGLSYAGKTRIMEAASTHCALVPELASQCNGGADFPPLATNDLEAKHSDDWFMRREELRCSTALQYSLGGTVVLADRWFVSGTGYIFARNVLIGLSPLGLHKDEVRNRLHEKKLYLPLFVYVNTPLPVIQERMKMARPHGPNEINGSLLIPPYKHQFLALQHQFYQTLSEIMCDRTLVLDGRDPPDENLEKILEWSAAHPWQPDYSFDAFERVVFRLDQQFR
jgi:hypothetical protein